MRALTPHQILRIWERTQGKPAAMRALEILAGAIDALDESSLRVLSRRQAGPGTQQNLQTLPGPAEAGTTNPERRSDVATPNARPNPDVAALFTEIEGLPVGRVDALLIQLRSLTFGTQFAGLAQCPCCGERAEFEFNAAEILSSLDASDPLSPTELCVEINGSNVRFRLPQAADLIAAGKSREPQTARAILLERCVIEARDSASHPMATDAFSPELVAAIAEAMVNADPQADVRLELSCPACRRNWSSPFDIAAYLWVELQASARRLLREVHTLAGAYGWHESDILALTPARRQAYLELLRA